MNKAIRGKVARILDNREIAINVGSAHGVRLDMYFDIMDPRGEDIMDPDTGEVLGSIDRSKVRVKVVKVQEKLSVASTYRKKQVNIGGIGYDLGVLSRALMPQQWVTKYETLKTNENTWEDLDEKESYVKTGDPVVQVIEQVDAEAEEPVSYHKTNNIY